MTSDAQIAREILSLPVTCLTAANFDLSVSDIIMGKNAVIGAVLCCISRNNDVLNVFPTVEIFLCYLSYMFISHFVVIFFTDVFRPSSNFVRSLDNTMYTLSGCVGCPK
jgi:hypothetical protein